jgi:hypothetical protein
MVRLGKLARFEIILGSALLLSSCKTGDEAYNLADVANANARKAIMQCDELEHRVLDLEARLGM